MSNRTFYALVAVLLTASVAFWYFMFATPSPTSTDLHTAEIVTYDETEEITLTMYHAEGCDCCVKWADYLEDNGFIVDKKLVDDPHVQKEEHGIPPRLRSCHTGIVNGYIAEGHVHAEDIRRMLAEQPDAVGISAPGMPPNSPGMDLPVDREYQIILFDDAGNAAVYATHGGR
ncbi:MAG: DUF411 domain-containing protein [Balneolaceae bacterium]